MPAYFTITFELNKESNALGEFFNALVRAGLKYKSGCWEFESNTFDEIIKWNQNKLDEDFVLGYTEHYSHDYRQMLFEYLDFAEVRLFIMNKKGKRTFSIRLIVPEDDFVEYVEENGHHFAKRMHMKMEYLKNLAKTVWTDSSVLAIQTSWEVSGCQDYEKISLANAPQTEPFSIIPQISFSEEWNMDMQDIGRDGILLEKSENWFPIYSMDLIPVHRN